MRPSDGDQVRFVLPQICFPQNGETFLRAPFAGRLAALDLEVQMRPAAAAAFLAQQADASADASADA